MNAGEDVNESLLPEHPLARLPHGGRWQYHLDRLSIYLIVFGLAAVVAANIFSLRTNLKGSLAPGASVGLVFILLGLIRMLNPGRLGLSLAIPHLHRRMLACIFALAASASLYHLCVLGRLIAMALIGKPAGIYRHASMMLLGRIDTWTQLALLSGTTVGFAYLAYFISTVSHRSQRETEEKLAIVELQLAQLAEEVAILRTDLNAARSTDQGKGLG
ncbi:MAG: hypothetical protein KDA92_12460 [Planctomycetales bacterium]|nr:hypothetical protein [Planctomycetales bacterium]MCA9169298.1 hypothetical protein [Planctomycetales bacterium]